MEKLQCRRYHEEARKGDTEDGRGILKTKGKLG